MGECAISEMVSQPLMHDDLVINHIQDKKRRFLMAFLTSLGVMFWGQHTWEHRNSVPSLS